MITGCSESSKGMAKAAFYSLPWLIFSLLLNKEQVDFLALPSLHDIKRADDWPTDSHHS